MKYIIDIKDEPIKTATGENLYQAKNMKTLVFDEYGLKHLQPINISELKERNYKKGAEKAWKTAKALYELYTSDPVVFASVFEDPFSMSVEELIDKFDEMKREKALDSRIEVGDEVIANGTKFVVTFNGTKDGTKTISGYDCEGLPCEVSGEIADILVKKTGNHYDVRSTLYAMQPELPF